jgi:UDP-N-acetylmuramate: L-alanyl-gamma-D-glutamyl-meso-diaminopimelate ligase
VRVYDEFAHHPTAIATTLAGLRGRVGSQRILAVLEPRSNTMRLGCHNQALAGSLSAADRVFVFAPPDLGWDAAPVFAPLVEAAVVVADLGHLIEQVLAESRAGDHILVMSNGAFGGIHERLLAGLNERVGGGGRAIPGGA